MITASAVLLFVSTAESNPALNVHLVPADFSVGCAAGGIDTLTCEELNPEGTSTGLQFAFVVVSGVDSLTAVQFGVTYQQTVGVLTWQSCTGGVEIPQGSWPDSATGLASAWGEVASPADSGAVIPVGYFLLDAGSSGTLTLVANPATNEAIYVDHEQFTHSIDPAQLGVADVGGTALGYSPCGTAQSQASSAPPARNRVTVVLEPGTIVLPGATGPNGLFLDRGPRDFSALTVRDSVFAHVCQTLGITRVRKSLPLPEDVTEHHFTVEREVSQDVIKQLNPHDPGWNRERFVHNRRAAGIDSIEFHGDSTIVLRDSGTKQWSDRFRRTYTLYFEPPQTPENVVYWLRRTSGVISADYVRDGWFDGELNCESPYFDNLHQPSEAPEFYCGEGGAWVVPAWPLADEGNSSNVVTVFDTQPLLTHEDYEAGINPFLPSCSDSAYAAHYHGTGTTGTIVARGGNFGTVGVAPRGYVQISPLQNTGTWTEPRFDIEELATEIVVAGSSCIIDGDIASFALSTDFFNFNLREAIDYLAQDKGVVVLAAQGETSAGPSDTTTVLYPCAWDDDVCCVGPSDRMNEPHPRNVETDIFSPGDTYWYTSVHQGSDLENYVQFPGLNTSGSRPTAFAAGVALLIQAGNGDAMTSEEIIGRLKAHGSAGPVHAYNAVSGAIPVAPVDNFQITTGPTDSTVVVEFETRVQNVQMWLHASATCQGEYRFGGPAGSTYDENPAALEWKFTLPATTGELWVQLELYESEPPYDWGYIVGSAIPTGTFYPISPATPDSLFVSEVNDTTAVLQWSESTNATSYAVYRTVSALDESHCADPHQHGNSLIFAVVDADSATANGIVTFVDDNVHPDLFYSYQMRAFNWLPTWPPRAWESSLSDPIEYGDVVAVSTDQVVPLPRLRVFPNPSAPSVQLTFDATTVGEYTLRIFDVGGRHVRTLAANQHLERGEHGVRWDGTDDRRVRVASGAYFLVFEGPQQRVTRRLVMLR